MNKDNPDDETKRFTNDLESIFGPVDVSNYSTDLSPIKFPANWLLGTEAKKAMAIINNELWRLRK